LVSSSQGSFSLGVFFCLAWLLLCLPYFSYGAGFSREGKLIDGDARNAVIPSRRKCIGGIRPTSVRAAENDWISDVRPVIFFAAFGRVRQPLKDFELSGAQRLPFLSVGLFGLNLRSNLFA
jgi:hypothetical protein